MNNVTLDMYQVNFVDLVTGIFHDMRVTKTFVQALEILEVENEVQILSVNKHYQN